MTQNMESLSEDLRKTIDEVDAQNEKYRDFSQWLSDSEDRWNEFTLQEKDAFRQAFSRFVQYTRDPVPPEDIEEIRLEIQTAFRQPLREAIRERLQEISDLMGTSFTEPEITTLLSELDTTDRDSLIDKREGYSKLLDLLREAEGPLKQWMKRAIQQDKSRLLMPEEDLLPELESTSSTFETLRMISAEIDDLEWSESLPDRDVGYFSVDWLDADLEEHGPILAKIEEVASLHSEFRQANIQITPILVNFFTDFTDSPVDEPFGFLESFVLELEDSKPDLELLTSADALTETKTVESIPISSEDLDESLETLHERGYSTLSTLEGDLNDFHSSFAYWADETKKYWAKQNTIIDVLVGQFGCEPPNERTDEEEFGQLLRTDPRAAISTLEELRDYIETQKSDLTSEIGDESVDLLTDLITSQSVSYSDYSADAISDLDEHIALALSINESE